MAKFRVYGVVTGGKYLGVVEADSAEEAVEKAGELDECCVSLCHQCASECDGAEISDLSAEPADADAKVGPPKRRGR